jgi:hypothetical protein
MNASMARRIRCAESLLIYAIDRHYGRQRNWNQAAQSPTHAIRLPVVDRNGNQRHAVWKQRLERYLLFPLVFPNEPCYSHLGNQSEGSR